MSMGLSGEPQSPALTAGGLAILSHFIGMGVGTTVAAAGAAAGAVAGAQEANATAAIIMIAVRRIKLLFISTSY